MFFGQLLCLFTYLIMKKLEQRRHDRQSLPGTPDSEIFSPPKAVREINNWVFLPLACLDATSSSINYVALILTTASSYQMLRGKMDLRVLSSSGSVIIFTGLVSTAFLGMKIKRFQWMGMFMVTSGLVVIGLTDYIYGDSAKDDINGVITG